MHKCCLIAVVQLLAERNISFRGTTERIGEPDNGNFLGILELLAEFDPIMAENLKRQTPLYTSNRTQDELIDIIGGAVRANILEMVKQHKYYAVLLDCTPDTSRQEQMSFVVRHVSDGSVLPVGVYEHFLKFTVVDKTTEEFLASTLNKEINDMGLKFDDMRGQGYDNGANMKGHTRGVQARVLSENRRAFYIPCACHNYNLIVANLAQTCPDAMHFFGIIQSL